MSATLECRCANQIGRTKYLPYLRSRQTKSTPSTTIVPFAKRVSLHSHIQARSSPLSIFLQWHHHPFSTSSRKSENPVLEDYLKKAKRAVRPGMSGEAPARGALGPSSIFEVDRRRAQEYSERERKQRAVQERIAVKYSPRSASASTTGISIGPDGKIVTRNRELMSRVLNPLPTRRKRWEARKVIKELRRTRRLPRRRLLELSERQSVSRSHFFKTSVKKLAPLARQIAGRQIDEAITQMRFSNKKAAREVMEHLEHAKNEAMVKYGMGLGLRSDTNVDNVVAKTTEKQLLAGTGPIEIETKDKKRKLIEDRTAIYIDQAWVGRGSFEREPEYRARGKINILRKPYTSISVLLKENRTLIRQALERKEAKEARKPRSLLPDRPVTAQHQYYCW